MLRRLIFCLIVFCFVSVVFASEPIIYTVEYRPKPAFPPALNLVFDSEYKGFTNVYVVTDNWYYASRERAASVNADAFIIPGGSTSDVPFYDGSLDSYVELLKNPGMPTIGFCAGLQFLCMAQGGICANRSGEHGNETATIFEWDEIFHNCPNPYTDRAAHNWSIVDMPEQFRNYAATRTCWVTFIKHVTMPLYGSQLHIESMSDPNTGGPAIISNFRNVIMERKFHGIAEAVRIPGEPGKVRLSWWQAKTDSDVVYQVFHSTTPEINFTNPTFETSALEAEISGLEPDVFHYFAVRASCAAFIDSNVAVYPVKPDGHKEIIFQNGLSINGTEYDNCEAAVIREQYPDYNYGKSGSTGTGELYWWNSGLIKFNNLHTWLSGKKIIGGKLTFIFVGGVGSVTSSTHVADISVYRILKPWNEGVGFGTNTAGNGEVTWNSAQHNSLPWEVPGCQGATDRFAVPIFSHTLKGDGSGISFDGTINLPADLLQTWVDYPDSNCGVIYEKFDTYPHDQYFYFEDNENEWFMNRPRLTVYYIDEEPSVVQRRNQHVAQKTIDLFPNYPNPFNNSTTIPFQNNEYQTVKLTIYNINGKTIRTLKKEKMAKGFNMVNWNGLDDFGNEVSSGVYLAVLTAGMEKLVRRMLLLK